MGSVGARGAKLGLYLYILHTTKERKQHTTRIEIINWKIQGRLQTPHTLTPITPRPNNCECLDKFRYTIIKVVTPSGYMCTYPINGGREAGWSVIILVPLWAQSVKRSVGNVGEPQPSHLGKYCLEVTVRPNSVKLFYDVFIWILMVI